MPDQLGLTWWCERKKQEGKNERVEEGQKEGGEGGRGEKSAKLISAASVVHTPTHTLKSPRRERNNLQTAMTTKKVSAVSHSL